MPSALVELDDELAPAPAPVPTSAILGRPPTPDPSPALIQQICDEFRAGVPVTTICVKLGFNKQVYYRWCEELPAFAEVIARARASAAHAYADRAVEIAEAAFADPGERGEKARGAAVAAGVYQWQAERRLAGIYGQRSAIAIDARVTVAGETAVSYGDLLARRTARLAGPAVGACIEAGTAGAATAGAVEAGEAGGKRVPAAVAVAAVPVASTK